MSLNSLCIYAFAANIFVSGILMLLPPKNHTHCLVNDGIITTIVAQPLQKCVQECVMRVACLSLNYRRLDQRCELFPFTYGNFVVNDMKTGPCVHIVRSDITEPEYPTNCSCTNQDTCIPNTGACVQKECPNLKFPHVMLTGNMRTTGSRVRVNCSSVLFLEENGRTSIQCHKNGTWDYEPKCISRYLGCYLDNNKRVLMPDKHISNTQMTLEMCINHCHGYNYAAPQHYSHCFCGNVLDVTLKRPETDCSAWCVGNTSQLCGGAWRGSVYRLK